MLRCFKEVSYYMSLIAATRAEGGLVQWTSKVVVPFELATEVMLCIMHSISSDETLVLMILMGQIYLNVANGSKKDIVGYLVQIRRYFGVTRY